MYVRDYSIVCLNMRTVCELENDGKKYLVKRMNLKKGYYLQKTK